MNDIEHELIATQWDLKVAKDRNLEYERSMRCRTKEVANLNEELSEAKQRIKRLEEAGDAMAAWLLDPRNLGGGSSMASQWYKAKEAKP